MKEKIQNIMTFIYSKFIKYKFYIIFLAFMLCSLYVTRYPEIGRLLSISYIKYSSTILDLFWIFLLLFIIYNIKGKYKKVFVIFIVLLFTIFPLANYFFYRQFGTAISWKDLYMSSDGAKFLDALIPYINKYFVLFVILLGTLGTFTIKNVPKDKPFISKKFKITFFAIWFLLSFLYFIEIVSLNKPNDEIWLADFMNEDKAIQYTEWYDSGSNLKVAGSIQYIIRDFYFSFLKKNNKLETSKEAEELLNLTLKNQKTNLNEENYFGYFEDKNLIYIMMESLDDWMVSEEVTPNIYRMMNEGINFTNHYSTVFVTGSTGNTEFIANTGLYPKFNSLMPCFAYQENYTPYSIANVFKNEGYVANSFHMNDESGYNRGITHKTWGYEEYYNAAKLNTSDDTKMMDSEFIRSGLDKINTDDKFMDFIITYTPHQPYAYDKKECTKNLDYIKSLYPSTNYSKKYEEEFLCGLSSAKETDDMFGVLLEHLEKEGILDDTVIVAFSDHVTHTDSRYDTNKNPDETVFFIWNNQIKENIIVDKLTTTINIIPTIYNLFGIKTEFYYPGYDALNSDKDYIILKDYNYFDGNDYKKITEEMFNEIKTSEKILDSDFYKINSKTH